VRALFEGLPPKPPGFAETIAADRRVFITAIAEAGR
jgi:hypothetical protein